MAPKRSAAAAKKVVNGSKVLWRGVPVTAHDIKVYKLISRIPPGKVATYGTVAKAIQSGPRGVGQALRRNPFAPQVPCHRVVSASRDLHGFRGSTDPACSDLKDKRTLLSEEGVKFADNKVAADCMYAFTPEDIKVLAE
ncbi:unnamed protein product [Aphanomyces euteiches]|uniref:Methylated-DNA--protein-cysteine methyltransferase n=1 Tax=Aphanomyces euteiches TaxID=100861 RepID=A0A6G0WXA1_9STRA|nr:hypothetical protein Ae201684_010811 [Aphanomyces euteiches]KAH9144245.1 hypothetical protein AeRB84_011774 [Aphanomyces euteiches]